ncbi:hypothetical protein [Sphingobium lactosutens]|uniref:hypothetical protein n=1 Tax=Sphingobium lactosutens TaxID=522773 RepID=UPI00211824B0|nr:hypothetical protein [Sphingobium lactosutens]
MALVWRQGRNKPTPDLELAAHWLHAQGYNQTGIKSRDPTFPVGGADVAVILLPKTHGKLAIGCQADTTTQSQNLPVMGVMKHIRTPAPTMMKYRARPRVGCRRAHNENSVLRGHHTLIAKSKLTATTSRLMTRLLDVELQTPQSRQSQSRLTGVPFN